RTDYSNIDTEEEESEDEEDGKNDSGNDRSSTESFSDENKETDDESDHLMKTITAKEEFSEIIKKVQYHGAVSTRSVALHQQGVPYEPCALLYAQLDPHFLIDVHQKLVEAVDNSDESIVLQSKIKAETTKRLTQVEDYTRDEDFLARDALEDVHDVPEYQTTANEHDYAPDEPKSGLIILGKLKCQYIYCQTLERTVAIVTYENHDSLDKIITSDPPLDPLFIEHVEKLEENDEQAGDPPKKN
ncbi:unnamed protein product, partial [Didymodactylos carnosus]